jgi:hypothetical protein
LSHFADGKSRCERRYFAIGTIRGDSLDTLGGEIVGKIANLRVVLLFCVFFAREITGNSGKR